MITTLFGKKVEVTLGQNRDGSRFVQEAYYIDDTPEELTEAELEALNNRLARDGEL